MSCPCRLRLGCIANSYALNIVPPRCNLGEMCLRKRRRSIAILLFPAIAIFFIVGWVLSIFGETRANNKKSLKRKNAAPKKMDLPQENDLEMRIIGELEEEQIAAE
jgi:hypothetical protein